LVKLLFTAFILDLLLKKLLQSSKSGIELLLAIAGTVVEILATAVAQTLAVLLAQQLGIQIQDKNCPHNIIQIGAVSLQREYPFIFVFFVGHFCNQNHIDGKVDLPVKRGGTAVTGSVDTSGDLTGHNQNTCGVSYHAIGLHRFGHGITDTETKIAQIHTGGKGNGCTGTVNDLGKS
jgi:hypothetical protein